MSFVLQRREWRRENREHQVDPEVPVLHESTLRGGFIQGRDVARGGGAAGEQVNLQALRCLIACFYRTNSHLVSPQSHHGGFRKRQDGLQQQLQPLREVCPAALQPEGEHPGRQDRRLYPLKLSAASWSRSLSGLVTKAESPPRPAVTISVHFSIFLTTELFVELLRLLWQP